MAGPVPILVPGDQQVTVNEMFADGLGNGYLEELKAELARLKAELGALRRGREARA
jgi:hypothetical protein